jgi:hypothetical protein
MRKLPGYLALGLISSPPQASDLKGFAFECDDIEALKNCKPGDCVIQMPTSSIQELHQSINWSAPDVSDQVNRHLQKTAMEYLLAYQHEGNRALGLYWARVKFGLKPTLRVVQMVTMSGAASDPVAYAIAEKQLYSSHYFETALDLSFCVRSDDPKQPGFYLIMAMGSEQAGLTGVQGSIVRKAAVGRSFSNLQNALKTIKITLEERNP